MGSVGLASFFSDSGHEIATAVLPSFLTGVLHGSAAALGLIEAVSDALTGLAKLVGGPLANDAHPYPELGLLRDLPDDGRLHRLARLDPTAGQEQVLGVDPALPGDGERTVDDDHRASLDVHPETSGS